MQSPANEEYLTLPKTKPPYKSLIFLLLVIGAGVWVYFDRQNLLDWWRLRAYQPPAAITQLAAEDTMTPYARTLFEVNHPQVMGKSSFNVECPNDGGEKTIVLGCYHSDEDGIYLLNVSDPVLNGVEQVTAAHEMLHAAYDRLPAGEKKQVDGWLVNYYDHDLHDPRIIQTMQEYKQTEPGNLINEMHSVFGTEIANLPAPLQNYYKRYFTDRDKITQYAGDYEAAFTSRQNTVTSDDTQLASMKSEIDSLEADLNTKYAQINSDETNLNNLKDSGNLNAYNAGIPEYNQMVNDYDSEIGQVQTLIASYNTLVNQRNSVALEEDQLVNELSANSVSTIK